MTTKPFFAALACCVCLFSATEAVANSWRVNHDRRASADFQDLNAAMNDSRVADGDTLYMDKACVLSGEQTLSKSVTVIGPGYFIGENDADEAYFSNTLYIDAEGVKLTGLHVSAIIIRENNAVVERCRVTGTITAAEQYENDGAQIRSCFLTGVIKGQGGNGSDGWNVLNNIFYLDSLASCISQFDNILIDHNTFNLQYYNWSPKAIDETVSNSTITNNIVFQGYTKSNPITCTDTGLHNTIRHNVSNYSFASEEAYPGNRIITSLRIQDLFKAAGSPLTDSYYSRIAHSEADASGSDGLACGVTQGGYPYVAHGYPLFVPRFESITVPSQPGEDGKLRIRMVIKNQNE